MSMVLLALRVVLLTLLVAVVFAGGAWARQRCLPNPNLGPWAGAQNFVNRCRSPPQSLNSPAALSSPSFRAPASVMDNKTGNISADGSALAGLSQSAITPKQIADWAISPSGTADIYYDGIRGMGILTPASTINEVNGVAGYVMSQKPIGTAFPTAVALNGIAIADVDGSSVWGANTIVTDCRYQVPCAAHKRSLFGAEFDISFQSTNSKGTNLLLGYGANSVQCSSCGAIGFIRGSGTTGRWSNLISSQDAVTLVYDDIGTQTTSANSSSQSINLHYRDSSNVRQTTSVAATPGGILVATTGSSGAGSLALPDGAVLSFGAINTVSESAETANFGSGSSLTAVNLGNSTAPISVNGNTAVNGNLRVTGTASALKMTGAITPDVTTVGALPTCNSSTSYQLYAVSDLSAAPTYRQTGLTGGGSISGLVMCNSGGAWEAH
jgi:LSD1 subclass zinc finger protein